MKSHFLLLTILFFLAPAPAQAQRTTFVPFRAGGPIWWGGPSWWGGPTWWGGPSVWGAMYPYSYYNPGWTPYSYYRPGLTSSFPYTANPLYYSGPIYLSGFASSDPPRTRATLYPAIFLPSEETVRAALAGDSEPRARLDIRVPTADALIYLDNVLTKQTGLTRSFFTPKLNPASKYTLQVRVVFRDAAGQERTLQRQVHLRAGDTRQLDFTK
jgi:uncharacterized protein (TIGR03000 family)